MFYRATVFTPISDPVLNCSSYLDNSKYKIKCTCMKVNQLGAINHIELSIVRLLFPYLQQEFLVIAQDAEAYSPMSHLPLLLSKLHPQSQILPISMKFNARDL